MNELVNRVVEGQLSQTEWKDWFLQTLGQNWETIVAGAMGMTLLATDLISVAQGVMADGKFNPHDIKDWKHIARGGVRVLGSATASVTMREALLKNPMVVLATVSAAIVTSVGVAGVVEDAKKLKTAPKGKGLSQFIRSGGFAAAVGAFGGAGELMAAKIDEEAWMLANVSLALVAVTRPRQFAQIIEQVRKSI